MNALYLAIGWGLHSVIHAGYAAMIWTSVLGAILFCTTKLCSFFNYQCPVEVAASKEVKKKENTGKSKES